ncbi:MAG: HAD-IA family hydrolase [Gemmatimonadales bacterium]
MQRPAPAAVLFDLDGTLIDSVRLILDSYHHTFAVHGLPARSDAEWLAGIGIPLRVVFAGCTDRPEEVERLIATYREYNLTHHDGRVTAYPGVVEMVRAVRAGGFRTGLVTSKNRPGALRGLKLIGLEADVDVVIGADEVANPKPHPEPVLAACRLLGVEPGRALYVGDSVHDMVSGRAAGALTAAVLWGPFCRGDLEATEPDHWLERPEDLLAVLRRLTVSTVNRQP